VVGPAVRLVQRRRSGFAHRRRLPHRKPVSGRQSTGEFEVIERPRRLIYTWRVGSEADASERVIVTFEARSEGTEVIVTHERIPNMAMRDLHNKGWLGCLEGLVEYMSGDR
jgi:uncharacterized protein YndB with AHSA1/START domain